MLSAASDASGMNERSCRTFDDRSGCDVYPGPVNERVLLVEDDASIRESTSLGLERAGFRVTTASDGAEAVDRFRRDRFDLVVLDVMLPEMDGFEVCRQLRRESRVPILMMTARTDATDVVAGLELGADDYVTKPFDLPVLVARARAVVRRSSGDGSDEMLRVADIEIDRAAFTARRGEADLSLTTTEFRLLAALAGRPGPVFTRAMLLELVWSY